MRDFFLQDWLNIPLVYYGIGAGNSGAHIPRQARRAIGVLAAVHVEIQISQEIGIDIIAGGRALAISRISKRFAVKFGIICVCI